LIFNFERVERGSVFCAYFIFTWRKHDSLFGWVYASPVFGLRMVVAELPPHSVMAMQYWHMVIIKKALDA